MMISLNESSVEGFASGTAVDDPAEALRSVRSVLDALGDQNITDAELATYKSLLKQQMNAKRGVPEYWLKAIAMRYIDGKDFTFPYSVTGNGSKTFTYGYDDYHFNFDDFGEYSVTAGGEGDDGSMFDNIAIEDRPSIQVN